jgi:hypothetical protein
MKQTLNPRTYKQSEPVLQACLRATCTGDGVPFVE